MNRLELVGRIMSIGAEASGKNAEAKKEAIDKAISELNDYENVVKNCSIPLVSNQRELLIDFSERMFPQGDKEAQLLFIDQYLEGNL